MGKKLRFTWRGKKIGGTAVEFDDELKSGYIVFTSNYECKGVFRCCYGGPWKFTGKKILTTKPRQRVKTLRKEYEVVYERRREQGCDF